MCCDVNNANSLQRANYSARQDKVTDLSHFGAASGTFIEASLNSLTKGSAKPTVHEASGALVMCLLKYQETKQNWSRMLDGPEAAHLPDADGRIIKSIARNHWMSFVRNAQDGVRKMINKNY